MEPKSKKKKLNSNKKIVNSYLQNGQKSLGEDNGEQ